MDDNDFWLLVNKFSYELLYYSIENPDKKIAHNLIFQAKAIDILNMAKLKLNDHEHFFKKFIENVDRNIGSATISEVIDACTYIKELLDHRRKAERRQKDIKLFASAQDKLGEASISFRNNDFPGVLNNLNTCIELALKEKLNIPTVLKNIGSGKILNILANNNIGPVSYIKQVREYVFLYNSTKHQGYSPTKSECVTAIKSTEDLLKQLEKLELQVPHRVLKEIHKEL